MATTTQAIVPQPSFYGDYEKGEELTDWMRKYELSFPPSYSDMDKVARFELQCAAASPAETWFTNLSAADKGSWTTFRTAFRTCWPKPVEVTLTVAQKKDRIHSLVLKDKEIGVMIEEDRGRDWGHVKWARKVSRMAQGFNDNQCHLLDVVLENTPQVLRDFLTDHYATWADFEADVAKISASQLGKAKQRLALERKLREDVDKLQNQIGNNCKNPPPASQNLQIPYVPPPAYCYGYRHATTPIPMLQSQQNAPPQPIFPPIAFQNPQIPTAPQVPQTPQATNPGFPQTPTRARGGSPADRARVAVQYASIIHHPDMEAGKQAYNQQVQDWHTQHGTEAVPNSQRPYPLKPGTSPIGSRQCFNCGIATAPPHQAYDCSNTPLPPQETKWRETISRLVSRTLTSAPMPSTPKNVQFVTPATGPPANVQYGAPPVTTAYLQYGYYQPETYDTYEYAGNEYGPQQ
ncbi:hypothetical protein EV702DRAFT_1045527 [Suillus placidus]|uniref:Uncharacterized protein n=1 Tax=Suillus placidus TaxID=48579 RepID=A0A9P6ZVC0_9AGAM|nr:hypothetical protein EV702DRAFT_1045527 [Suillus placidus]